MLADPPHLSRHQRTPLPPPLSSSCSSYRNSKLKTSNPCNHRNQQYSIIGLTNAAGTLVERYSYSAYGTLGIYAANGTVRTSSAYANRYTYTGREYDPDLNLYHFRARWYDAATGGFISRDPLGYVDGMSLYRGYFGVKGMDHQGLCQDGVDPNSGCCCCAESIRIDGTKNKDVFNEPATGAAGFGTEFTVEIITKWIKSTNPDQSSDCNLEWNEALEDPLRWPPHIKDQVKKDVKEIFDEDVEIRPQVSKKWYDQYVEFWYLKMFRPWRSRDLRSFTDKCDGTPNTVLITDTPGMWGKPFGRQVIQFELVVYSGADCECDKASVRFCFEYWVMKAQNKAPVWKIRSVPCGMKKKLPFYKDINEPDGGYQDLD